MRKGNERDGTEDTEGEERARWDGVGGMQDAILRYGRLNISATVGSERALPEGRLGRAICFNGGMPLGSAHISGNLCVSSSLK